MTLNIARHVHTFAIIFRWKFVAQANKIQGDERFPCPMINALIEIFFSFFLLQYLTKQNNALREVNDTRLKIYENIEISIQDLEKQNHRLNVDNSSVKKINKT